MPYPLSKVAISVPPTTTWGGGFTTPNQYAHCRRLALKMQWKTVRNEPAMLKHNKHQRVTAIQIYSRFPFSKIQSMGFPSFCLFALMFSTIVHIHAAQNCSSFQKRDPKLLRTKNKTRIYLKHRQPGGEWGETKQRMFSIQAHTPF